MMASRGVAVRPWIPTDAPFIEALQLDPAVASWRSSGVVRSSSERTSSFFAGVLQHSVVVRPPHHDPIGYISVYDASMRHGTAWLAAAAVRQHRGNGSMMAGLGLVIAQLFGEWPLRRLYLQSQADSLGAYLSATRLGVLRESGRLSDYHVRPDGTMQDACIFSLDRQDWVSHWAPHFKRFVDSVERL